MGRYLSILSADAPTDMGRDGADRQIFVSNHDALVAAGSTAVEEEMVALIIAAGGGTRGTDIFVGNREEVSENADPITTIITTSGGPTDFSHDGCRYERWSFMIVVRGLTYSGARTRALLAWRALDGVHNTTVSA